VEIIKLAKEGYLFPMKTPVLNSHFFWNNFDKNLLPTVTEKIKDEVIVLGNVEKKNILKINK
jgi:hypothetical protein